MLRSCAAHREQTSNETGGTRHEEPEPWPRLPPLCLPWRRRSTARRPLPEADQPQARNLDLRSRSTDARRQAADTTPQRFRDLTLKPTTMANYHAYVHKDLTPYKRCPTSTTPRRCSPRPRPRAASAGSDSQAGLPRLSRIKPSANPTAHSYSLGAEAIRLGLSTSCDDSIS